MAYGSGKIPDTAGISRSQAPAFTIASTAIDHDCARIGGHELHHMRDVLRLRPGAGIELIDEAGARMAAELIGFETDAAIVRILHRQVAAPAPPLILGIGLIREPRMDFIIEKAVELGASEIWPLICEHSLSRRPGSERIARWRRLAAAAVKQSLTVAAPAIKDPADWRDFLAGVPRGMLALICRAEGAAIGGLLKGTGRDGVAIAIGPEGDFTAREVEAACDTGFRLARLNRNRLRSETAALAALSLAAAALLEIKEVN